jgi:diaminopimelate decarboxylase
MPMSADFEKRLYPILDTVAAHFGTPFHIYDEVGIRDTAASLKRAFAAVDGFREYFAVKALPNPRILAVMRDMGFGFDCSSAPEVILSRRIGARGEDIMFTSNNTFTEEFELALGDNGCILNLDDISLVAKVPEFPELICFRYNPGPRRTGNAIIGNPVEAKYGLAHDQVVEAYRRAMSRGAKRFGIHTMVVSNERNYRFMVQTVAMLFELIAWVSRELGIRFEFMNMGGGLGIPYRPTDEPLDLTALGAEVTALFRQFQEKQGYAPRLYMESGRYMTGPHGALVVSAINRKDIYRTYIGVDACMSALMRPGMYGAYHHVTVPGKLGQPPAGAVDVVGSLCENNDKFAIQRELPPIADGDILVIHDTGAHGHAMGFNYNGRLRPKELLLRRDGAVELIRRAETLEDHLATLTYRADMLQPSAR